MTRIPLLEAIDRTVESKQEPAQILNKYLSPLKKDGLLKVIK